jgi:hypothetical protein
MLAIRPRDLESIAILEETTYGPDREDSSIHISIPIILGSCQDKEAVVSVTADLMDFSRRYQHTAAWFISEELQKKLEAADDMLVSDNPAYGGIILSREIDNYHLQVRLIKQFGMYTVDIKWHNDRIGDEFSLQQYYAYLKLRPTIRNFDWEDMGLKDGQLLLKGDFSFWQNTAEELRQALFLSSLALDLDYEIFYYLFNKIKIIGYEKELIRRVDYYYHEKQKEMILEIILWNYDIKVLSLKIEDDRKKILIGKGKETFDKELEEFLTFFINFLKEEIQLVKMRREKYFHERPIYGQK